MCFRPPQVGKPKKCPACGAMNPYTQTVCKKCKAELPADEVPMFKCPECGKENRADTDACDFCGMLVSEMIAKGYTLPEYSDAVSGGPVAPTAPGFPSAPVAPGAPKPPAAPSAPAAPIGANIPAAPTAPKA